MKVHFLRHQAHGVCAEFPFAEKPSELQERAVARLLAARYGERHPKTGERYWFRVYEVEVLGPSDVPKPPPPPAPAGEAGKGSGPLADLEAAGTGRIKNPK